MKDETTAPSCASCPIVKKADRLCMRPDGKAPRNCPTVLNREMTERSRSVYTEGKFAKFALVASRIERAGYAAAPSGGLMATRPRLVETIDFARHMGYKKLGLIFCMGLVDEAGIVAKIFETNGFAMVSAACKVGGVPKPEIGLGPEDIINPEKPENVCNPVMQAMLMNEAKVDFNIVLGLCVGHDSLALAHLEAPATVLAVKDRLLGHNPLTCVYQYGSYYKYLGRPLFPEGAENT